MLREFKTEFPKFHELLNEVNGILTETDCIDDIHNYPDGQLSLQVDSDSSDSWTSGVGRVKAADPFYEYRFNKIRKNLKCSTIADYINWLAEPVYRARLMISRPKSCYSFHKDRSPRLHLPITTNPQCRFLFTDPLSIHYLPAEGKTFWVDTRKEHTFINGSNEARVHIVMVLKE